ncbi:esterase-like activity of phytase family protein [Bacteroidetes/Chlorobi group bacterium MS-B_bin-24]|nr:MAG: esterase-like activity of phytase family protein [Bacteroidetes/Chlorobi group bacterium MS-B_bin-24]
MKLFKSILAFSLFLITFVSCSKDDNVTNPLENLPEKSVINKQDVLLTTPNGVKIINGGFGSALAFDGKYFYALTDRGPNFDGANSNDKIFPKPDFTPQIGKFSLNNGVLKLERIILLKDETGKNLTGLPNPLNFGGTGENALDLNGNKLNHDPKGIDPEGLVVLEDGSFWVSDEYGPHLIHFDANGRVLEWLNPFGNGVGSKKLPEVYKFRRPNRGMEGLTITPDKKYLVGIMQSPLLNPNKDVQKTSKACRILFYEIATAKFKEYIYLLESTGTAVSEIAAITNTTFLVLERDGKTPGKDQGIIKKLYKIDISNATNVHDVNANGLMINGKTIEQLSNDEIIASGIKPVSKEEFFDILSIPNYPHDKPEGIVIIDKNKIAIVNDDDFGIDSDNGNVIEKIMPLLGNKRDENIIYFVKLAKSLY